MAGKENIVTRIAHKSGLTKKATYKLMEAFKDVLTETLLDGERFHIHGLLTLKPEYKEECIRYNPKTREKVVVSPHIKVKMVIGSELERALFDMEDNQEN